MWGVAYILGSTGLVNGPIIGHGTQNGAIESAPAMLPALPPDTIKDALKTNGYMKFDSDFIIQLVEIDPQ